MLASHDSGYTVLMVHYHIFHGYAVTNVAARKIVTVFYIRIAEIHCIAFFGNNYNTIHRAVERDTKYAVLAALLIGIGKLLGRYRCRYGIRVVDRAGFLGVCASHAYKSGKEAEGST